MKKEANNEIIEKCLSLEKELLQYRLWGNLIPSESWNANLRKVLPKNQWDTLRKFIYKKDSNKCFICGTSGVRLEAHEHWKYDYEHSIQKLHDINALCSMCHLNQHLGFAFQTLKNEEKINKLIDHWCKINNESNKNFRIYAKKVLSLWELKNQFDWKILDKNGKNIFKGLNFDDLMLKI